MPGIAMALCQVPFTSLTANACVRPAVPWYCPPALQLPGETHEILVMAAPP
jgi:hypothetical protein